MYLLELAREGRREGKMSSLSGGPTAVLTFCIPYRALMQKSQRQRKDRERVSLANSMVDLRLRFHLRHQFSIGYSGVGIGSSGSLGRRDAKSNQVRRP